jgi:hypothetical protein
MKKLFLIFGLVVLSSPILALASTATLQVDTGQNNINTLEATVQLPKGITVTNIYDGDSALLIWIKEPVYDAQTNTITFTGLTPGGFQGVKNLFSFSGNFSASDLNNFSFSSVTALQTDGQGTSAEVKLEMTTSQIPTDTTPPEAFSPSIGRTPYIFNGQFFLTFLTQDKGVGIDHYDVAYTRFFSPSEKDWQKAESPLLLNSSALSQRIFVRAVDQSGNVRVESLVGPHYYQWLLVWGIIIVILICALSFIARRLF